VNAGETAAGLLLLALGAYVSATASRFPHLATGYPGPGLFPQVLGVLLAVQGIALVAAGFRGSDPPSFPWTRRDLFNGFLVVLAVGVYVVASPRLGFLVTSTLVLTGLMARLGAGLGRSLLLGPALAGALYLLFGKVLRVPLPPGLLG
jgi:putative tricarboxylic transport membrane protein